MITIKMRHVAMVMLVLFFVGCHKKKNSAPAAPVLPPSVDSTKPAVTYPYTEQYNGTVKVSISKEFTPTQDDRGDSAYTDVVSFYIHYLSKDKLVLSSSKSLQINYLEPNHVINDTFANNFYGNTDSISLVLTGGQLTVTWNSEASRQYYNYWLTGEFSGSK